jgi:uncharacterized protein YkwD
LGQAPDQYVDLVTTVCLLLRLGDDELVGNNDLGGTTPMLRTSALAARPARTRRRGVAAAIAAVALAVSASACMPAAEHTFLDRTNALRSSQGLAPLAENDVLTAKAEAWAQHMAATGQLAHSSLTQGLQGLAWKSLGENVGMSTPTGDTLATLQSMLAGSPEHRSNMLGRYTHMGVGLAKGADGRMWVAEVFATL